MVAATSVARPWSPGSGARLRNTGPPRASTLQPAQQPVGPRQRRVDGRAQQAGQLHVQEDLAVAVQHRPAGDQDPDVPFLNPGIVRAAWIRGSTPLSSAPLSSAPRSSAPRSSAPDRISPATNRTPSSPPALLRAPLLRAPLSAAPSPSP